MNRQEGLTAAPPVPVIPQYLAQPGGQEEPPGMLHMARRFLRGRYHWLLLMALVMGGVGAFAGFKSWAPQYQSTGQIHVRPTLPRVIYPLDDQQISGMYGSYMATQASLMTSTRVIDFAMMSDEWRRTGRGVDDQAIFDFKQSLKVRHPEGAQIINISFLDEDAAAARAGVKAVIDAYLQLFVEEEAKRGETVLNALETRRVALNNELKGLQDRVHEMAGRFGTDSVQWRYSQRLTDLGSYEKKLTELNLRKVEIEASLADPQTDKPRDLTAYEIGQRDQTMRNLLSRLESAKAELDDLLRYHRPEHPTAQASAKRLYNVEEHVADYARTYNKLSKQAGVDDPKQPLRNSLDMAMIAAEQVRGLIEQTEKEIADLARKSQDIGRLNEEIAIVKEQLQQAQQRLTMKNVESVVQGRLTVISDGDRPGLPVNRDDKSKRAIMWGGGGASLAFGLVMLLGASDRRHRYVEDAVALLKRQPLLGVVPNMSRKNDDPAQAAIAAMGVNQIRAMLQLGALAEQRRTFAITSGSAGEGKTSLSVALGMSFAHSGTRTLLIDFDLVGRSLSARCDRIHRERIGELLVRSGTITPAQLREAVDAAGERRTRLGEVLVSLGHLTQECLDESLQRQASTAVGLPDALEGAPLSRCVVTVGQGPKSLSILPGGFATAQYISSISPLKLRELLQRAKREYDVVLVDTGPLPGSLEAAIVSTLVDEVLVVVSHGTHRSMANRAIEQLDRIGARVAGIVFNRALRSCVDRYGSSSQVSRWQEDLFAPASGQMPSERFGPLVSATAGYRSDEPAQ